MTRNGADSLVATLADLGLDTCFANPGTTEMHLVAALGRESRIGTYLCLFEGVATGAADGYARMRRRPAATLLHLGPGLANGLANLHNAKKAATPVVNIVGEHATYHTAFDAPLTADIEGLARPMSDWCKTAPTAESVGPLATELMAAVSGPAGGIATLIVPNDVAWTQTEVRKEQPVSQPRRTFNGVALASALDAIKRGQTTVLLLGAAFISERAAQLATAIEKATGCVVLTEAAVARMERGGGIPALKRLPFHVDLALEALSRFSAAVLVGARAPIAFFAYPDRPSELLPANAECIQLSGPSDDVELVLEAVADALGIAPAANVAIDLVPEPADGPITLPGLGAVIARALPAQAIVVDESITSGIHIYPSCAAASRHDWINNRGGSIGYSMPVAVGCAVACPDRKVLCITGDGSAFYTPQALWTMARYKLDVVVVVLANRSYRILNNEMAKIGAGTPDAQASRLMSLNDPEPKWTAIAEGHGIAATQVATHGELLGELGQAFASSGPRLIEVLL